MILLGFDFETTGVDPKTCLPLEWGSQTYNTDTTARGKEFSTFIWDRGYPDITEEITTLTGITSEMAKKGCGQDVFLSMVDPLICEADALVAYNLNYDMTILKRIYASFGKRFPDKKSFCMRADFPWPESMMKCQKLQHRALDIGLPMDTREKHRSMADVTTMWDIMDLYSAKDVLEFVYTPWVYLRADICGPWIDDGKQRDAAKSLGFSWEQAYGDEKKFPKTWVKRVKLFDVQRTMQLAREHATSPFLVVVLT
jgi:DNA polymerase III epsilon subunit-like protein